MENYDEEQAAAVRTEDVNRAEEERLITCVLTAKYLEGLQRYYNRNIKGRSFAVGDLVLRRKQKTEGMHKLSSPWEGPYIVKKVTQQDQPEAEGGKEGHLRRRQATIAIAARSRASMSAPSSSRATSSSRSRPHHRPRLARRIKDYDGNVVVESTNPSTKRSLRRFRARVWRRSRSAPCLPASRAAASAPCA